MRNKMRRRILTLLLLLACLPFPLRAQAPVRLTDGPRADAIAAILAANDIRTSLQFCFTMTRHSPLLTEDLVSQGRACFVFPDKVRWEVTSPRPSLFVINGLDAGDRRMQSLLRNLSRIQEKGLINDTDFAVTVYAVPGQWQVDMVPLRRDLGQLFSLVTLLADPATGTLRSVVLTGTGGDLTQLELRDVVKGQPLDDALFRKP